MALTTGKFTISTQWTQTKTATGLAQSVLNGGVYTKSQSPTISGAACNRLYFVQGTLAAGASVTIDLSSVTEPVFGEAITPDRGYSIQVYGSGTTWKYEPGAANALEWFLSGTSPAISGSAGAQFGFGDTTAGTIDGTHKNIKITNTAGAGTLTYTIYLLVGV